MALYHEQKAKCIDSLEEALLIDGSSNITKLEYFEDQYGLHEGIRIDYRGGAVKVLCVNGNSNFLNVQLVVSAVSGNEVQGEVFFGEEEDLRKHASLLAAEGFGDTLL